MWACILHHLLPPCFTPLWSLSTNTEVIVSPCMQQFWKSTNLKMYPFQVKEWFHIVSPLLCSNLTQCSHHNAYHPGDGYLLRVNCQGAPSLNCEKAVIAGKHLWNCLGCVSLIFLFTGTSTWPKTCPHKSFLTSFYNMEICYMLKYYNLPLWTISCGA